MSQDLLGRFAQHYEPEPLTGCWLWLGAPHGNGYGSLHVGERQVIAHRLSFTLHRGPIPAGMYVCHRCDTPMCVNPDHLFLGTQSDNTLDSVSKGRHHMANLTECRNGHPFTPANTLYRSNGRQMVRSCRECRNR